MTIAPVRNNTEIQKQKIASMFGRSVGVAANNETKVGVSFFTPDPYRSANRHQH